MYFKGNLFALAGDRLLRLTDGRRWLDVGAKDDLAAVTDSAHNTTAVKPLSDEEDDEQ